MPKWRQDRETGKLTLVDSGHGGKAPRAPAVIPDINPFTSPIDGRVISSRTQLRLHNEEHGVAALREYGENDGASYFTDQEKYRSDRLTGNTRRDREERLQAIIPIVTRNES